MDSDVRPSSATTIVLIALAAALALAGLGAAPAQAILPIDLQTDFSQRWDGGLLDDVSGTVAANAGDVNGDGTPDVVMGAASGDGEAYILYGNAAASRHTVDLRTGLTPAAGYLMDGLDPTVSRMPASRSTMPATSTAMASRTS